jgi:hypothetical protein
MNEWFKIGALLMLLVLLTAEDCSNSTVELSHEDRQAELFMAMENNFEKENLETDELKAFENRSLLMLSDLIDYMNIYSNSSLTKEFRLQSRQMIESLFSSEKALLSFLEKMNLIEDTEKGILLFEGNEPIYFNLNSYSIVEDLAPEGKLVYAGEIEFIVSSNNFDFGNQNHKLEIYLTKSEKQFGENSLEVWGVSFGKLISN